MQDCFLSKLWRLAYLMGKLCCAKGIRRSNLSEGWKRWLIQIETDVWYFSHVNRCRFYFFLLCNVPIEQLARSICLTALYCKYGFWGYIFNSFSLSDLFILHSSFYWTNMTYWCVHRNVPLIVSIIWHIFATYNLVSYLHKHGCS